MPTEILMPKDGSTNENKMELLEWLAKDPSNGYCREVTNKIQNGFIELYKLNFLEENIISQILKI